MASKSADTSLDLPSWLTENFKDLAEFFVLVLEDVETEDMCDISEILNTLRSAENESDISDALWTQLAKTIMEYDCDTALALESVEKMTLQYKENRQCAQDLACDYDEIF